MTGYTKLFSSIVTSTIWLESNATRIVWITMLALADKHGEVQGSVPGLARLAGVSVEECRAALQKFLSPDPDSRTKDDEGRRIEEIDGGWSILNHLKYREMASREESRVAESERKKRYRAKLKRNETPAQKPSTKCPGHVRDMSPNVPDMSPNVPEHMHIAEAEAEADTPYSSTLVGESAMVERPAALAPSSTLAEKPSWEEFWKYCQGMHCGLAAEWYARDKFEAAEGENWQGNKQNWRAYARRCKGWWQQDGSPMEPSRAKSGADLTAEKILRAKELEEVQAGIRRIKSGYESHETMREADRTKLKGLFTRQKELKSFLGYAIQV